MSTVKEGMMDQSPAWKDTPSDPVVIRHRSGSVSSRRAYPTATNPRFVPNRTPESTFEMISVGEGNDVYLPPDEQVDPLSEEAKNRIKRIRNIGGGVQVLIEQEEGDLDNELRTMKVRDGNLMTIQQTDEEIEFATNGAGNDIVIGDGGQIGTTDGLVHTLIQPLVGTGSINFVSCPPSSSPLGNIAWKNGMITNSNVGVTIVVGDCCDCGSTVTPGPS